MTLRARLRIILATLLLAYGVKAQTAPATLPSSEPLHVLVMTIGPGDASFEQFGHDALCIYDPAAGNGLAYSYGEFSFDQPNFVGRFILGRMRYWMDGHDLDQMFSSYGPGSDRDVWMQELNFTPEQAQRLAKYLADTAADENKKYYRYDYYRDNCTTRVRDAIDLVLDGQVRKQLDAIQLDRTYRWYTRKDLAGYRWLLTGIELTAGQLVDRKLTAWQDAFVPLRLQDHLREVTISDASGRPAPLVLRELHVHKAQKRSPPPATPPNWLPWFSLIGVGIAGTMLLLAWRAMRRLFLALAITWCMVAGLAGIFMISLRLFTDHEAGYRNENLFQFEPLSLALIVLIPAMLRGKPRGRHAISLALAVLSIALLGIIVKLLPWFFQNNWWMIALALPVHAALFASLLVWKKRPDDSRMVSKAGVSSTKS